VVVSAESTLRFAAVYASPSQMSKVCALETAANGHRPVAIWAMKWRLDTRETPAWRLRDTLGARSVANPAPPK
jgi:hypothetical protein